LVATLTLFFGRFFTADLFVVVFLPDVDLLALDLARDLADEIALFISHQSARLDEDVKRIFE